LHQLRVVLPSDQPAKSVTIASTARPAQIGPRFFSLGKNQPSTLSKKRRPDSRKQHLRSDTMTKDWPDSRCLMFLALALSATPTALSAQESPTSPVQTSPSAQPQPFALGLGSLIHPLKLEKLTLHEQAQAIPQEKKDRVHFFLINGLDPLYSGNLNGVAAYFRSIGFANTSCHQLPSTWKVRRQIETIRRSDPEARIVLLGYSAGANFVRSLANNVQRDGIQIDCLIYLGGDTVFNSPSSRPPNVGQIVNITGHGMIFLGRDIYFKGDNIDGAVNHRVDARHILLPGQSDTIKLVGEHLIALANKSGEKAARSAMAARSAEVPSQASVGRPKPMP
jgi:hypothetical protein